MSRIFRTKADLILVDLRQYHRLALRTSDGKLVERGVVGGCSLRGNSAVALYSCQDDREGNRPLIPVRSYAARIALSFLTGTVGGGLVLLTLYGIYLW